MASDDVEVNGVEAPHAKDKCFTVLFILQVL